MSYEFIVPNTSSNVIFDGNQAILATSSLSTAGNFNKYLKNNGSGNLSLITIPATDVVTDASNRFVTDTQKTAYDAVNTSFTTNKNTANNICVLDGSGQVPAGSVNLASKLSLSGGTMTGNLNMDDHTLQNCNLINGGGKTNYNWYIPQLIPYAYGPNSTGGSAHQVGPFWLSHEVTVITDVMAVVVLTGTVQTCIRAYYWTYDTSDQMLTAWFNESSPVSIGSGKSMNICIMTLRPNDP